MVDPLLWFRVSRLRSKDYGTRDAAFSAATKTGDIDALVAVIDDPNQYTRGHAIRALGEIADARTVPALIRRLDDPNFNNVEDAARALARIGDARGVDPLMQVVRSTKQHEQARRTASVELAKIADAKAVPALLDALSDADVLTRSLVLDVLAALGDSRAVPHVISALRDPDPNIRWKAAQACGSLGDPRAVEPLLALLQHAGTERGPDASTIVQSLGKIGDRRGAAAIVPLLRHPSRITREAAAKALDATGWTPANDRERAQYAAASHRWDQFAGIDWEAARPALLDAARLDNLFVARDAVATLVTVGGKRAVEPLLEALADPQEHVAEPAALALAQMGDIRAVGPLLAYSRRYQPIGGYKNDPNAPYGEKSRAEEATAPLVQLLERNISRVPPDVLETLARQEDRRFGLSVEYDTPAYGDGRDDFTVLQSFARVRQLAEGERHRRGLA